MYLSHEHRSGVELLKKRGKREGSFKADPNQHRCGHSIVHT